MRRGHAQIVRQAFAPSPVIWQGDGRHYVRPIESLEQAEAAAAALKTKNDVAAFYALHQAEFEGRRPKYRGFVVHDRGGSVDGTILVERDGFCWKPLGVTWPKGRKRPTKGLKFAVQALCRQEGICGIHPSNTTGHVNRSTLGQLNCTSRTRFCGQADVVPMGRPGDGKTKRPTTSMRRKMPAGLFALPRSSMSASNQMRLPAGVPGAYPMDTMPRARNARSRAISMLNAGFLDRAEAQTILDRTTAFTEAMARRKVRGWSPLPALTIVGRPGSYRSARAGAAEQRAAANRLPSRDRKGRFVPARKAAPGLLDYPGGGGSLPSRDRSGRFVSTRRRAPTLGHSASPPARTGWFARLLGRANCTGRANCGCANCR